MRFMKINKIIMLCAAVMLCALTSLSAQTRRDEKKVPEEQIPISIRNSFQQEFGVNDQSTKGGWYIYFEQQDVNDRVVATPLSYIYRGKSDGKKVEVKYNATGKLESAKGISKKDSQAVGTN